MILAETLTDLLTDVNHLSFEAITGLAEFAIGAVVARIWIKIHDRKNHAHQHCKDVHDEQGELF